MREIAIKRGETRTENCDNCGKEYTMTCPDNYEAKIYPGYCHECGELSKQSMDYINAQDCTWSERQSVTGSRYYVILDREQDYETIARGTPQSHWINSIADAANELRKLRQSETHGMPGDSGIKSELKNPALKLSTEEMVERFMLALMAITSLVGIYQIGKWAMVLIIKLKG